MLRDKGNLVHYKRLKFIMMQKKKVIETIIQLFRKTSFCPFALIMLKEAFFLS